MKRLLSCVAGAAVALLLLLGPSLISNRFDRDIYKEWLIGPPKTYAGIIRIWHIYTWQTAKANSGAEYLRYCAKSFEKKNRGVFVELVALNEQEASDRLERGETADIYSFSLGGELGSLCEIDLPEGLIPAVRKAALTADGKSFGVPYMMSAYTFMANTQIVEQVKDDIPEAYTKEAIKEIAELATFTKKQGKTETHYTGLVFESGKKLAAMAIAGRLPVLDTANYGENVDEFAAGRAALCVASMGVWGKVEKDYENGKGFEYAAQPAGRWTDLVQFLGCGDMAEPAKLKKCQEFIALAVTPANQTRIISYGALPVLQASMDDAAVSGGGNETNVQVELLRETAKLLRDPVVPNAQGWAKERELLHMMVQKAMAGDEHAAGSLGALVPDGGAMLK